MPVRNYPTSEPPVSDHADLVTATEIVNRVIDRNRRTIAAMPLNLLVDALREINLADRYLGGAH